MIISGFSSDGWYLLNPETYGFYRVNYDSDNWLQLHNQLLKDPSPIAVSARARLLDDAFTMAMYKCDVFVLFYNIVAMT